MSNTSLGCASKGSKYWMQVIVEDGALRARLEKKIGADAPLCWISPLKADDYREYGLHSPTLCALFGITKKTVKSVLSFWPNGGPHWDGMAICGDTLFLIEAKSHIAEMRARSRAKSSKSIELIQRTMAEVQVKHYPNGTFSNWEDTYYQLANRLIFLHKLNEKMPLGNIKRVVLVLLNFVNDITHDSKKRTSEETWRTHYKDVWKKMTGSEATPNDVINLYFDVTQ